ncbi:unnamed protein product [Effrenium voratum]|nr:unnamed protein product [Effrenium voratum]
MVLVPKRSWLGVFFALYVHLWRAHRKLRSTPEEFSYAQLSAPLLDAQVHDLEAGERRIRAVATPPGWSGKTVVLVHDLKMRLETWSLVWEQLREQGHRLIAADLAGHGESTLTPGSLELSSLSMDLKRLLEYFHVTEGAVVGHGVGGFIAVQFLLEHRLAARRLPFGLVCVSCTAGNLQKAVGREFLRTLATAFAALRLPAGPRVSAGQGVWLGWSHTAFKPPDPGACAARFC